MAIFTSYANRLYGSPYSSPSSFANPRFLDINLLIKEGFIFVKGKEDLEIINKEKNINFNLADNSSRKLGRSILSGWEYQVEERKREFNECESKFLVRRIFYIFGELRGILYDSLVGMAVRL